MTLNKTFMRVFLSGNDFTAESTEAMRVKCLSQGHSILMQLEFKPLITVSLNRHLTNITYILIRLSLYVA